MGWIILGLLVVIGLLMVIRYLNNEVKKLQSKVDSYENYLNKKKW